MSNTEKQECEHKFVHRETTKLRISYGRSDSIVENFKQTSYYFCEKCLEEKKVEKEWSGQTHYSDCPDWVKDGNFTPKVIW